MNVFARLIAEWRAENAAAAQRAEESRVAMERVAIALRELSAQTKPAAPPEPAPGATPTQCPRCKMVGYEGRGAMVVPYSDGTEREVGRLYGCPHCGLAWFIQQGVVREFGYMREKLDAPAFTPPPGTHLRPAGTRTDGAEQEREKLPLGDQDMRWSRRGR